MQSADTCLCLRPYTPLEILNRPLTTDALKTIWKHWSKSMKIVTKGLTAFFAPMLNWSWSGFWIAAYSSTALPESNARTAAMNTYWPFPVNDGIFAPPVIKRGWWNSGNGSVKMLSKPSPTGIRLWYP